MLQENKKRFSPVVNTIVVLHFILGPLILAIVFYLGNDTVLGHTAMGLFFVSILLYWWFGRRYNKVDLFRPKTKNNQVEKNSALRIIHINVVLEFLFGPLLLAMLFYWAGEILFGHISIGLFVLWVTLYWFYGIDYFEVGWLQKLKKGET